MHLLQKILNRASIHDFDHLLLNWILFRNPIHSKLSEVGDRFHHLPIPICHVFGCVAYRHDEFPKHQDGLKILPVPTETKNTAKVFPVLVLCPSGRTPGLTGNFFVPANIFELLCSYPNRYATKQDRQKILHSIHFLHWYFVWMNNPAAVTLIRMLTYKSICLLVIYFL